MGNFELRSGSYWSIGLPLTIHGPTPVDDEDQIIFLIYLILKNGVSPTLIRAALTKWMDQRPPEKWITNAKERLALELDPSDPFKEPDDAPTEEPSLGM
jgi:hypothetical protein